MKGTFREGKSTFVKEPTWLGDRFAEEDANTLWLHLPEVFRRIALEELRAGNTIATLFLNDEHGLTFVEFAHEPRVDSPEGPIIIYGAEQAFSTGFDDTKCVYKDPVSGTTLSFYKERDERGTT